MSSLRVNAIQNTSGVQQYLAQAWVNFNGMTGTIRAAGNVSSVTRNGTGDYTINFTNAFSDSNYSAIVSLKELDSTAATTVIPWIGPNLTLGNSVAPSFIRVAARTPGPVNYDAVYFSVAVFR